MSALGEKTFFIHVYTAPMQPATNFVDDLDGKRHRIRCADRALRTCYGCRKLRRAENLGVQVFYDGIRFWCQKGGCAKGKKHG